MNRVTTHEAKTNLSRILSRVREGEEFVICRGDVPVALLGPVKEYKKTRSRPAVGTVTSASVLCTQDAFAALSDEDLREWGL